MLTLKDCDLAPDSKFTLRETSAITGLRSARLTRLVNQGTLPRAAYSTARGNTTFKAVGLPALLYVKHSDKGPIDTRPGRNILRELLKFTQANWKGIGKAPSAAAELWTLDAVGRDLIARIFLEFAQAVARLEWAKSRVVRDPDMRAGMPTIRGTRIGVYEAAGMLKADGMEGCREVFPDLSVEDIEAAEIYARAVPDTRVSDPGRELEQLEREGKIRVISKTRVTMQSST